ncbi:hypothetical protein DBB29_12245 [Pandoraea cepalis]|uniref:CopG family transcriptional regulator n=1 Tax=Pandoraea cepalis TaxID=2508294 RepID=A0AAW7MGZ7_9BURK|nr:hypothetical protein [Pandoraea cepalis]MDN4572039.1 hypothetical protein [Pandoraea cepalis]MDN4578885.1 hypothetical protein [Pandoraea cepalis]
MDKKVTRIDLTLEMHPNDMEEAEYASRRARVPLEEFCRLAIHTEARRTLDGDGVLTPWPLLLAKK